MNLTPIKIRGRKRSHPASRLISKLQSAATTSSQSSLALETKRRRQTKSNKETTPAMPTLQGLPQELLEMIFLESMNIALPQCSPTLGQKLSSQTVILEFTMRAFFHTVDHRTVARNRTKTSDSRLQSAILSCRFFTWPFFLKYVDQARTAMIKVRGKAWEKTGVEVPGVDMFDGLLPFQFTKIPYLSFAEGFHVPEKLLHGPWTKDSASLLYVLVSLNGEIDWEGSLSGETAKSGMRDAIKEGNEHAVAALAVLLGVPKAITTEILRYAVIECGCNINTLRHLLFNAQIRAGETSEETLHFHDPKLWTWAEANGEKGDVLKDMLKNADEFSLEFYFEENSDWRRSVAFPYTGSKFDARTTFDQLVRELLRNLYRNYGRRITRGGRSHVLERVNRDIDVGSY
ncbi:hypothetical protein GQ44DRAFT_700378 [Phaeosphaeriaceae sp. PMI808]|nr:hypothetical protein GQ44DRAFT_700378 [Phaeosphaeriaceae sp. PMI808]